LREATAAAGISKTTGHYWLVKSGGVRPRVSPPAAAGSLEERETLSRGLVQRKTFAAAGIGAPATRHDKLALT
jgi:hypothetical protein